MTGIQDAMVIVTYSCFSMYTTERGIDEFSKYKGIFYISTTCVWRVFNLLVAFKFPLTLYDVKTVPFLQRVQICYKILPYKCCGRK